MAASDRSYAFRRKVYYLLVGLGGMGPEALAWSIPIGWGLTSLASWWYYRKGFWRGKSIVNSRKEQPKAPE